MAISSWTHGKIIRAEQSGNLDGYESNQLLAIKYAQDADNDTTLLDPSTRLPNVNNSESLWTNRPMKIMEYKITVASNDLVVLHQFYGDSNHSPDWDTTDATFHKGVKQWRMVPGSKQKYIDPDGHLQHSNQYATRTIHFDTDWIQPRNKFGKPTGKGFWKNNLRPITLSKNKGHKFGFTVSNFSGNEDAFFKAVIEIKRWKIID